MPIQRRPSRHLSVFLALSALSLPFVGCDSDEEPEDAERSAAPAGEGASPAEHAAHKLARWDTDGDGALSPAEVHGPLAEKFATIDTNSDGKLDAAELTAWKASHPGRPGKHRGKRGGGHESPEARADKTLARLDADHDGAITQAEVDGDRFADKFAIVDADHDGRVTKDELVAFKRNHHGKHGSGPAPDEGRWAG